MTSMSMQHNMGSTATIRVAAEADIPAMHRVRQSVRENVLCERNNVCPDDYRGLLRDHGRAWVCELGDRIVGFAVADRRNNCVWALFVEPDYQCRGIGQNLHDTVVGWMFDDGADRLWLTTAPETRAERFCRRAQWVRAAVTPRRVVRYELTREAWRGGGVVTGESVVNIAAYKFVALDGLKPLRDRWLVLTRQLGLRGTVLISAEGINMFVAGSRAAVDTLLAEVRGVPGLADLEVKESYSTHLPFNRMLVKIKKEIIAFGVDDIDPRERTSRRVSADQLKAWLDAGEDLVLLDVRNTFEYEVGTFESAVPVGIDDFRNFPNAVGRLPEALKHRRVVTFCTGGIRCEKAGPHLEKRGFEEVYQLDGGILKYFEQCGGAHYRGECFVFDKRVALDSALRETDTIQCYACQAPLTSHDRQSPRFKYGRSCPHCYKSEADCWAALRPERHAAIAHVTTPLPGSVPYDNHRPVHVASKFDGMTVIEFLEAVRTRLTRADWARSAAAGQLHLDGRPVGLDDVVGAGQTLVHTMPGTVEPKVNAAIRIVYEDDAIVVIDKPAPLPMHPCGRFNRNTLSWILERVYQPLKLRIAHRLDANTTGVVVMSKTRRIAGQLQPQFEDGHVHKRYIARVHGRPGAEHFTSTTAIMALPNPQGARVPEEDGLPARTDFTVIGECADGTTVVQARPLTGRTNQIRIHLWDLGHAIVGDELYLPDGRTGTSQTLLPGAPPMCLHAERLEFDHPVTGERVSFEVPAPSWATPS